jgi:hypothetical protein
MSGTPKKEMAEPTVADRLWDVWHGYHTAESDAEDAIMDAYEGDCGCTRIAFDDYDGSFELKGVTPGWTPTPETLAAWWAAGFDRCWICYSDGTERYCDPQNGMCELKRKDSQ